MDLRFLLRRIPLTPAFHARVEKPDLVRKCFNALYVFYERAAVWQR